MSVVFLCPCYSHVYVCNLVFLCILLHFFGPLDFCSLFVVFFFVKGGNMMVAIGVPLFKFFQVQASSEHFRPLFVLFLCPCFVCVYVSCVFMCAFHVFFKS